MSRFPLLFLCATGLFYATSCDGQDRPSEKRKAHPPATQTAPLAVTPDKSTVVTRWPDGTPKKTEEVVSGGVRERYFYKTGRIEFDAVRDTPNSFHGQVRGYYPSGVMHEESLWNHGQLLSGKFFRPDGTLDSEIKGSGWRPLLYEGVESGGEYYIDGKYDHGAG